MSMISKMSGSSKITIGVAVIITAIIIAVMCLTNSPIDPINSQLRALKSDNIEKAYSYTSSEFQQTTSLSAFETFVNNNPILKQAKIIVTDKEINGNEGLIKGSLHSVDGAAVPIEYRLIVEDGKWKLLQININGDAANINEQAKLASSQLKRYENVDSRYTIDYPANWDVDASEKGTVIFSGPKNTPSFYSTINIQTVLTKNSGGEYKTIKLFMDDIKHQAMAQSPNTKFLESGSFNVKDVKGIDLKGAYMLFTYSYKNVVFKQWQIVVLRNDNQVFYAWAYTSPMDQYTNDLPTAKRMLASWAIY